MFHVFNCLAYNWTKMNERLPDTTQNQMSLDTSVSPEQKKKIQQTRAHVEGDSGEEVILWRLTSLYRWSKTNFKSPCNFEELSYGACLFSSCVIYENVDIVFIEIYCILMFSLKRFSWKTIHYGWKKPGIIINSLIVASIMQKQKKEKLQNKQWRHWKCWLNLLSEATFNKTNFFFWFLRDKIIFLISNMFIYAMVGNSKFIEMHVQCV